MTGPSRRVREHMWAAHMRAARHYRQLAGDLLAAIRPDWYGRTPEWQHQHGRLMLAAARDEVTAAKAARQQTNRPLGN